MKPGYKNKPFFYMNHTLKYDCKIKRNFVRLEYKTNGYCNIVNLVIPKNDDYKEPLIITDLPKDKETYDKTLPRYL